MTQFPIRLFEGQTNFIKTLRFHPCAEPMPLLVETFFPAFIQMAIDLTILGITDIAFDRLKQYPRYGKGTAFSRSLTHSQKKRRDAKPYARRVIQNYKGIKHPYTKGLTSALFWIYGPIEKINFVIMFYNAVDQFFMNWSTLLIQRGYCEAPAISGPLSLAGNDGFQVVSTVIEPVSAPIILQNRALWSHTAVAASLPAGDYTIVVSASIRATGSSQVPAIRLRLRELKFGVGLVFHFGGYVDAMPDEWSPISVTASIGSELVGTVVEWGIISDIVLFALCEIKEIRVTMWANYQEHSF